MKKLFFISLFTMVSLGAFAIDMPEPPMGMPKRDDPRMTLLENLTAEQKACVETFGCKTPEESEAKARPEMPKMGERPEDFDKPARGPRPEMTEEQKEAMECMRNAMKECGVEIPEEPTAPDGLNPPAPNNDTFGQAMPNE